MPILYRSRARRISASRREASRLEVRRVETEDLAVPVDITPRGKLEVMCRILERPVDTSQPCGIHIVASSGSTSLNHAMREIGRALWRRGYYVSFSLSLGSPINCWGYTSIRHLVQNPIAENRVLMSWGQAVPDEYFPKCPVVEWNIADGWHWSVPMAMKRINDRVGLLLLPGENNVQEFLQGGLGTPYAVAELGVDTNIYHPHKPDRSILDRVKWFGGWCRGKPVKFLFMFSGYVHTRKGLPVAIRCFQDEFRKDEPVAFLVKNVAKAWGQSQVRALAPMVRHGYKIGLLEEDIPEDELAVLYSTADCIVNTHHREGFGMVPLEAMACGTPAIVTQFDGPSLYVNERNGWPVPIVGFEEPPTESIAGFEIPRQVRWPKLNEPGIRAAMRAAYEGGVEEKREAAIETARQYTWERTAEKVAAAIESTFGITLLRRHVRSTRSGKLSILIPARNGQSDLDKLCTTVRETSWTGSVEVLVLDDASDPPMELPNEFLRGKVRANMIRSDDWIGEGKARDLLLKESDGGYVFLTDIDVEFPDPNWAKVLKRQLDNRKDTILHPLVVKPNGAVWSAGGMYREYPGIGVLPAWHQWANRIPNHAEIGRVGRLPYCPTVGWFCRREALTDWDAIPGYFPTIFWDVDMAFWLRRHGVRFATCWQTHIIHNAGGFTATQTSQEERQYRFLEHAKEFIGWWGFAIRHDIQDGFEVATV